MVGECKRPAQFRTCCTDFERTDHGRRANFTSLAPVCMIDTPVYSTTNECSTECEQFGNRLFNRFPGDKCNRQKHFQTRLNLFERTYFPQKYFILFSYRICSSLSFAASEPEPELKELTYNWIGIDVDEEMSCDCLRRMESTIVRTHFALEFHSFVAVVRLRDRHKTAPKLLSHESMRSRCLLCAS